MGNKREVPGSGGEARTEHQRHEVIDNNNEFDSENQCISLTFWQDVYGHNKKDIRLSWPDFITHLKNVKPKAIKSDAPLIKFAVFGDERTPAYYNADGKKTGDSLRQDKNVLEVTGIEGDADNGALSVDQAIEKLEHHNIKAVVCTTYSHAPKKPRLRVFAPLSAPCKPEDRRRYVARLNGILAGNLGEESFRLSQSFFIGGKLGCEYLVKQTFDDPEEGYFIDQEEHLDQIAIDPDPQYERAHTREYSYKNDNKYEQGFSRGGQQKGEVNKSQQKATIDNISFEKGGRDEAIFCLANHLVKGKMPPITIEKYIKFFAAHCSPPFPEKEVFKKIDSAFRRAKNRDGNLTQEVREYVMTTSGNIMTTDVLQMTTNDNTKDTRKKVNVILGRLVKDGILERTGRRHGEYRRIDNECETIDYKNASTETVPLWLPFGLGEMAEIMPGNIILVAGEPNAGKTAFLLNVVHQNMFTFDMYYYSSEMGASELRKRLMKFKDVSLTDWKCIFKERAGNFGDVIQPGGGKVNIIDFLEIYDNFYEISGKLAEIHKKLNGAIAIVAIQKNKGADAGLGGERSLEKPRLYLNMGHGTLKIRKCKNFGGTENPTGKRISFKLVDGYKFTAQGGWHYAV